ncbi:hypothetical protein AV530_010963 [Patagioenas fasciata monilis]|uniref:Uncharacterized protein n=1 Tax=Patagioenas fasciata monilis TaxID=372326 RepID=A0A1V4K8C1_PATFA|nr:hypothetical protein AV530_010963 [Patagioenas fasciata monilis]
MSNSQRNNTSEKEMYPDWNQSATSRKLIVLGRTGRLLRTHPSCLKDSWSPKVMAESSGKWISGDHSSQMSANALSCFVRYD